MGHIYLIREREFIRMNEPVYKLGKTEQAGLKRSGQYPKDSSVEIHLRVDDCHSAETELLKEFRREFKPRTDIGAEYFEGDRNLMVLAICGYNQVVNDAEVEQKSAPMEIVDTQAAIDRLDQIFYPIFYAIQRYILNEHQESSMRSVQAAHDIQWIYELSGRAMLKENMIGVFVDLDKFGATMKKLYGKPKGIMSEQYHKYVGVHNALCNLVSPVATYMAARQLMVMPAKFIAIKLKPMLAIDSATHALGLKKCSDFATNGGYYTHMPGC